MLIKGPDGRIITKPRTAEIKPGWVEAAPEPAPVAVDVPAAEPLVMPIDEAIRLVDEMESWTDDSAKD